MTDKKLILGYLVWTLVNNLMIYNTKCKVQINFISKNQSRLCHFPQLLKITEILKLVLQIGLEN